MNLFIYSQISLNLHIVIITASTAAAAASNTPEEVVVAGHRLVDRFLIASPAAYFYS